MHKVTSHFSLSSNPVLIFTAVIAVLQVFLNLLQTGELSVDLTNLALTALGAIVIRNNVYAPDTIDEFVTATEGD